MRGTNFAFSLSLTINELQLLRYGKTGNKRRATFLATLLQNELNRDVERFTTHVQTCLATNQVVNRFERGW